jgi:hypothetical protein
MDWTVEALCVLITGLLFVAIVVAGFTPLASLTPASFVAFGAAGVVFIGAAFALAGVQAVNYPPAMWVLPILPLLIIGVLCKDAVAASRASSQPERMTAISRPDVEQPFAALAEAPAQDDQSGQGGEGTPRALAASPDATPNELAHMAINFPELRATIARNPLTPQSVLDWLAQQGSVEVTEALRSREATTSTAA